jgi:hypothetical protein
MAFALLAYQGRTITYEGTLSGQSTILGPDDHLRFRVGRVPYQLLIELRDESPLTLASRIEIETRGDATNPASYRVQLDGADLATWTPGCYDVEISHLTSVGNPPEVDERVVDIGVLHLLATIHLS